MRSISDKSQATVAYCNRIPTSSKKNASHSTQLSLCLNRCLVNVDALLSDFTILEQRAVITFLWTERMKPADMHRRLSAQCGSVNCTSQRKVHELVETVNPEEQVFLMRVDRGVRQRRALKTTSNILTLTALSLSLVK